MRAVVASSAVLAAAGALQLAGAPAHAAAIVALASCALLVWAIASVDDRRRSFLP